ncbi:MAG: tetratricopeptide repeat protein [Paracoccaceae bacterium]
MFSFLFAASVAAEDEAALRAAQTDTYARMMSDPADPALMIEYAQQSIALGDYEAAISTLERALIYEPNEPVTHFELGVAYFRIGSYRQAEYNLNAAREVGLAPELDERAALYLGEIDRRLAVSGFSGTATAGFIYSSNANLGPDSEFVSFLGVVVPLQPGVSSKSDVGARATLNLRHRYDLGGPDSDAWLTDLNLYSAHFADETEGDTDFVSILTGPRLSLTPSAFGPKIRPFVTAAHARSSNDAFYTDFGAGSELSYPVNSDLTTFGRLGIVRRDFAGGGAFDSVIFGADFGAAVLINPRLVVRGGLVGEAEFNDENDFDNQEIGARASFTYSYSPGFAQVDGLWSLDGYASYTHRFFDEPFAVVDPTRTRDDDEFRVSLSHLFRVQDGFGVKLDVDYFNRSSNFTNFELDNLTAGVSAVFEF